MPKPLLYSILIVIVLAMIPPALIAWARTTTSDKPRIHIIQDMDSQAKLKTQSVGPLKVDSLSFQRDPIFADGRAMRPVIPGTVQRGDLRDDSHFYRGVVNGEWATSFPDQTPISMELLQRGKERYEIYCTPCHGASGYGNGIVNQRAMQLMNNPAIGNGTSWVQPKNIHEPAIRDQPPGQIYNTITHGIRNMAGYASQIAVRDRWAITAYVKALQKSQHAAPSDLPPGIDPADLPTIDRRPQGEES
jgi:mono/diheme cytochrome c family protein